MISLQRSKRSERQDRVVAAYDWSLGRVAIVLAGLSIFVGASMLAGILGSDDGGDLRDPQTNAIDLAAAALVFLAIALGTFVVCGAAVMTARALGTIAVRLRR